MFLRTFIPLNRLSSKLLSIQVLEKGIIQQCCKCLGTSNALSCDEMNDLKSKPGRRIRLSGGLKRKSKLYNMSQDEYNKSALMSSDTIDSISKARSLLRNSSRGKYNVSSSINSSLSTSEAEDNLDVSDVDYQDSNDIAYDNDIFSKQTRANFLKGFATSDVSTNPVLSSPYGRHVPRSASEMSQQLKQVVWMPKNSKTLKAAILGLPNSGKSTLINALMDVKVCSTSLKAHTTQCMARAVVNINETQLIFLDTPGIVTPEQAMRFKLSSSLINDSEKSIPLADMIVVVHDCSSRYGKLGLHPRVLRLLALYPCLPAVLVLNKVDLVKSKEQILDLVRLLTDGIVGGSVSHHKLPPRKKNKINLHKTSTPEEAAKKFFEKETIEFDSQASECSFPHLEPIFEVEKQVGEMEEAYIPEFGVESRQPLVHEKGLHKSLVDRYAVKAHINEEDVLEGRIQLSESQIKEFIENRRGWPKFKSVFITSALEQSGIEELKTELVNAAKPSPWVFPSSTVTDQDPYQLAILIVREKFMNRLKHQLPYGLKYEIENWDIQEAGMLQITMRVTCERSGLVKLLVGAKGCHVKKLAKVAEQDLTDMFKTDVQLRINVYSHENNKEYSKEYNNNNKEN